MTDIETTASTSMWDRSPFILKRKADRDGSWAYARFPLSGTHDASRAQLLFVRANSLGVTPAALSIREFPKAAEDDQVSLCKASALSMCQPSNDMSAEKVTCTWQLGTRGQVRRTASPKAGMPKPLRIACSTPNYTLFPTDCGPWLVGLRCDR
jgi:hypothetical protein